MPRILVIDDDLAMRSLISQVLARSGYEVETAEEGSEGLQLLSRSRFDLVISDIIMPGMEGIETIREIRALYPGLKIIAISGGGSIGEARILEYARLIGAHRVFNKPPDIPNLLAEIPSLLASADV